MVLVDMTLGIGENSYELNTILNNLNKIKLNFSISPFRLEVELTNYFLKL